MRLYFPLTAYYLLLLIYFLSPWQVYAGVETGIKCWDNDQGIRECGRFVPPEYIQKGYQELDQFGVVRDTVAPAKTEAELRQAAKLAEIKRQEERDRIIQQRSDQVLLNTFLSVKDIERVRDEKSILIENSIHHARLRNDTLQVRLGKRLEEDGRNQKAGRSSPAVLLETIRILRTQITDNEAYILEQQKRFEQVIADYAEKIARFKVLKPGSE